ncbi:MAG: BNR-4 repeat-containing protein [Pirellulales bacterium]|nr:BNR-4 repeat-containing protein [Pirellulales bacterium]
MLHRLRTIQSCSVSRFLAQVLVVLAALAFASCPCLAVNDVAGNLIVLNDNGAWSWFEDERAIVDLSAGSSGKLLVSSVANSKGTGGAARHGDVEVVSLDLATQAIHRFTLSDAFQADDHDSAALWRRTDGRYVAVYAKHGNESVARYRISTAAGDNTAWVTEQTISFGAGTTYSNVHFLSAENGGNGRLYDIARTVDRDPHLATSIDQGESWTVAGRLLNWPTPTGDPKYTGTDGSRPYLKYASNGTDEIHFISSNDHPRAYDNSIFHGVIRNGKVYDSFGNEVDNNVFDATASSPTAYTTVFNTDTSPLGFAWTTDLQLDSQSRPYAAMTARSNNNNSNDHRFLYARFDGSQWAVHEVAKAGGYLYSSENDYTGLIALDPSNPDRLFISTPIDPRTQVSMAHYEIFEGTTSDGGSTWSWQPITFNSTMDNLRPIVPKWDASHTALLWMRGSYSTYTSYDLDVVALTQFGPLLPSPLGDLDQDHDVDVSDYVLFLGGLHTDVTGLSGEAARLRGDLNGDLLVDFRDLVLFRNDYDLFHGAGALASLGVNVPEAPVWGLVAAAMCGAPWHVARSLRATCVF